MAKLMMESFTFLFCPVMALLLKENTTMSIIGVYVDSRLNFDTHTKYLCRWAARQINVLCWYARLLDTVINLAICKSFVLCNSNYCPIVWNFYSSFNKAKLKILKKGFALRLQLFYILIFGSPEKSYLPIPELHVSCMITMAIEIYKIIDDKSPS